MMPVLPNPRAIDVVSKPGCSRVASIVVISIYPPKFLERCLVALERETEGTDAQIIVVRQMSKEKPTRKFPDRFQFLPVSSACTVPEMRSLAAAATEGESVVFLEDDCEVTTGWYQAVTKIGSHDGDVACGAIEPDRYDSSVSWAVFFCEYARFMKPFEGTVSGVPGNHVIYKKEALERLLKELPGELRDYQVNASIRDLGYTVRAYSDICVANINRWGTSHLILMPYHHGRAFAGIRMSGQQLWKRILFGLAAPLLPVLLTARTVQSVFQKERYRMQLLMSFPLVFVFFAAWAAGEFVGYTFGSGESAGRWC